MFQIRLADKVIQIDHQYPDVEALCSNYKTQDQPELHVSVSETELREEQQAQTEHYTEGYLETICLYRKIALEMLRFHTFVMHASVVAVDGNGYAFLAPSGVGKSTQTRLWLEYFGMRATVVNGDKPLIHVDIDKENHSCRFIAYGTPWCGKESMGENTSVPLKVIYFLEQSETVSIRKATPEETFDRIFRQLLFPKDSGQMEAFLKMADWLVQTIPCFVLKCDMTTASVTCAYEAACKDA